MSRERGAALLEAVTALAVLGLAGIALVGLVAHLYISLSRAMQREREVEAASRVLAAVTLLRGSELEHRRGNSTVGEFWIRIQQLPGGLYRIGIGSTAMPDHELLATMVHRLADEGPVP